MTKRPRPEDCEVVWPVNPTQPSSEIHSDKRPEDNKEEAEPRAVAGGHPGNEKEATGTHTICADVACTNVGCAEVAVANVAGADVSLTGESDDEVATPEFLGDGPFWALLSRAGYSRW